MSAIPILKTKLHIPQPSPGTIDRPDLRQKLSVALTRKLTVATAPAGYGKTTLLAQAIGQSQWPVAWLSLDVADNDMVRWLAYLIAALQEIWPDVAKQSLDLLSTPQAAQFETVLTPLINDLAARPDTFVLVLDDYHLIKNEAVHQAFDFLLRHSPPQAHFCVSSRTEPPLALARLWPRPSWPSYQWLVLDEGERIVPLLQMAAAQGIAIDYARSLLGDLDRPQTDKLAVEQALIEPLSRTELDLLQLLAQGLPNKKIAEHQVVSINTVKWHLRNIYGKLGSVIVRPLWPERKA